MISATRLYLDEDVMKRSLVFGLRARNVDLVTAVEANMVNRSDEDHLTVAVAGGRALYSYNIADYCDIHQSWLSEGRSHCGIILAPQQRFAVGEELRRMMRLLGALPASAMRDRIEFLRSWS